MHAILSKIHPVALSFPQAPSIGPTASLEEPMQTPES